MGKKTWYNIKLNMENGYVRDTIIAKVQTRGLAGIVYNALLENTYNRPGDRLSVE